jgi:hypothetical protein
MDSAFLYKCLCALARAHRAGNMAGHLGAALAAGWLFGEDHPGLHEGVCAGVAAECDRIVAGEEPIWFDPEEAGITIDEMFAPFPADDPCSDPFTPIADALVGNIAGLHQSGHNVIFAALAMRALKARPDHGTPAIVEGITKLMQGFDGSSEGRAYFGEERGWLRASDIPLDDDDGFGPYESCQQMAGVVIDELIRDATARRRGFGDLHHIINHAAALSDLESLGYGGLARRGLAAHRRQVRLYRQIPDLRDELGPATPAAHDPLTPEFWADDLSRTGAMLTHRIKTLYGFHSLAGFVDEAKGKQAGEQFLYLVG